VSLLIVDDEPDMRLALRSLLGVYGYADVRTVASTREALDVLTAESPSPFDLILTDVAMPGLSGIELCRQVKATPHLADIPVLVVTGRVTDDLMDRAFAAGAHDFVLQGVDPHELLARVRAALNLKQELERRRARERQLVEVTRELERVNGQLRRLAVQDELTGVPNRRYFNWLLGREWGRAARDGRPLGLILADVDLFKAFNDRYGHLAGDSCLARVAAALTRQVRRAGDAVARYGGEEFAVVLPEADLAGGMAAGERIRHLVEGRPFVFNDKPYPVTVSVGVAVATGGPEAAADLLARADRNLYAAKRAGRNRVVGG
jgi:two-component system, chemotaxis family, response regulator WspR